MQMHLVHVESNEMPLKKTFKRLPLVRVRLAPDLEPKPRTGTAKLSENYNQQVG